MISEEFRVTAREWVNADAAARLLEECKSAWICERANALKDLSVSAAEREVKGSPEYKEYVNQMVAARTAANLLKVKMQWIEMRSWEQRSKEASARAEMKL